MIKLANKAEEATVVEVVIETVCVSYMLAIAAVGMWALSGAQTLINLPIA